MSEQPPCPSLTDGQKLRTREGRGQTEVTGSTCAGDRRGPRPSTPDPCSFHDPLRPFRWPNGQQRRARLPACGSVEVPKCPADDHPGATRLPGTRHLQGQSSHRFPGGVSTLTLDGVHVGGGRERGCLVTGVPPGDSLLRSPTPAGDGHRQPALCCPARWFPPGLPVPRGGSSASGRLFPGSSSRQGLPGDSCLPRRDGRNGGPALPCGCPGPGAPPLATVAVLIGGPAGKPRLRPCLSKPAPRVCCSWAQPPPPGSPPGHQACEARPDRSPVLLESCLSGCWHFLAPLSRPTSLGWSLPLSPSSQDCHPALHPVPPAPPAPAAHWCLEPAGQGAPSPNTVVLQEPGRGLAWLRARGESEMESGLCVWAPGPVLPAAPGCVQSPDQGGRAEPSLKTGGLAKRPRAGGGADAGGELPGPSRPSCFEGRPPSSLGTKS